MVRTSNTQIAKKKKKIIDDSMSVSASLSVLWQLQQGCIQRDTAQIMITYTYTSKKKSFITGYCVIYLLVYTHGSGTMSYIRKSSVRSPLTPPQEKNPICNPVQGGHRSLSSLMTKRGHTNFKFPCHVYQICHVWL